MIAGPENALPQYHQDVSMHAAGLLTRRAGLTPDREALYELHTGRRFTYGQLNARANRLANFLRLNLGLQKGDRVSILDGNSVVYVDLLYALGKIGAIFAPLNWRLTVHELAYIAADCRPRVLFYGPEYTQTARDLRAQVDIEHCISLDQYEDLLAQSSPAEPKLPPLQAGDPYCILYTSGTTGRPKGAVIPHRQVLWNCINTMISWGLSESDVAPVLTPMFHAGGLFIFLTPLFYAGGRIVLARSFDPEESLRVIDAEGSTVVLGVPTLFQIWMNSPSFPTVDFSKVRFFISGGAPCPVSLMKTWRERKGVVFRQGYGLTEVGVNCFSMTDEESVRKTGSVGKPVFHRWMRQEDAEGRDVPPGETGELLIAGPHVCSGYWGDPEATAAALEYQEGFPWPWFHTGDMGRQDEEGFFYIAGRYKDMIISGGENIYAAEVEAVFREHPAVSDAALIGIPDEKWGEVGLMVVVLKDGQHIEATELQDFCAQRLARYKIPKRVEFRDALPYSPYGKVMKAELRREYSSGAEDGTVDEKDGEPV